MKMKPINITASSKQHAYIFACFGLALGIFYSIGGLVLDLIAAFKTTEDNGDPALGVGTLLAFTSLFGMPILGYLIGLITGMIGAAVNNLLSYLLRKYSGRSKE